MGRHQAGPKYHHCHHLRPEYRKLDLHRYLLAYLLPVEGLNRIRFHLNPSIRRHHRHHRGSHSIRHRLYPSVRPSNLQYLSGSLWQAYLGNYLQRLERHPHHHRYLYCRLFRRRRSRPNHRRLTGMHRSRRARCRHRHRCQRCRLYHRRRSRPTRWRSSGIHRIGPHIRHCHHLDRLSRIPHQHHCR